MSEAAAIERLESDLAAGDADRRRRALINLKARATRTRQSGAPDTENAALRIVRAAGVPPRKQGLRTLDGLGLVQPLRGRVQERALYTLDLLLERCGKAVRDVTPDDINIFVRGRPPAIEAVLRSQIRLCFEQLVDLGLASDNPSPKRKHRQAPLPPAIAREFAELERFHNEQRSARGTRLETRELMGRAAQWAEGVGLAGGGLETLLWNDAKRLQQLAFWWARPRSDGELRAGVCMAVLFKGLLRLWRAHGRPIVEGRDRIRVLKRGLRSSGDDFGPLDLLDLKSEDPAPAPAPERCTALAEWYTQEARRLRAMGERALTRLLGLERERLIFFILWKVGVRRSSLASFRFDELKRDDEGMWYFDWCVTKRTRAPKRVVIQTWRVGDTTFSRWYAPQEFVDLLREALRDEGYDLEKYLETRGEEYVPWTTARDATFGPHFEGKRVAPVWRGKRGALSTGAVAHVATHIMRARLGMARGGAHAMRRRSIMDNNELARRFPQAAQALQHLTPETRSIYEWSEERSVRHMFQSPAAVTTVPAAIAGTAVANVQRPRATRAPRLSIDDLA